MFFLHARFQNQPGYLILMRLEPDSDTPGLLVDLSTLEIISEKAGKELLRYHYPTRGYY
jgi:hypothetical protein